MRHVEHIQLAQHWGTPHPDSMSVSIRGRPSSYVPLGNGTSRRAGAAMAQAAVNSLQPRTCGRLRTLTSRTSARKSRIMLSSFISAALYARCAGWALSQGTNRFVPCERAHPAGSFGTNRQAKRGAGAARECLRTFADSRGWTATTRTATNTMAVACTMAMAKAVASPFAPGGRTQHPRP
jgi:hypothetical protein